MATLAAGVTAPGIELPLADGKKFSLAEARKQGPVVAAFFKVSCPVCQYAFPYIERLYRAHAGSNVTFVGISQDSAPDTEAFALRYGLTFPMALEDTKKYRVSSAYRLTNVPSIFFIAADGEIELASIGWNKKDIETINQKLAQASKKPATAVWKPGEDVADFRAG